MKQTQLVQQPLHIRRFHQRMIMIRQHAPRERLARMSGENGEQVVGKIVHALWAFTYEMMMFVASRRDKKTHMTEVRTVRR